MSNIELKNAGLKITLPRVAKGKNLVYLDEISLKLNTIG